MSTKQNGDATVPQPVPVGKSKRLAGAVPVAVNPIVSMAAGPLPSMAEASAKILKLTMAQRFAVRQRQIDQEANADRRRMLLLFHDMDLQTLPPLVALLGLAATEVQRRNAAIARLTKFLRDRALQHAAHAGCAEHNPAPTAVTSLSSEVIADIKLASDILYPLFTTHVVPTISELALVRRAFDEFARGELFVGPHPADGAPDSANLVSFTTFAELARVHADKGQTALWSNLLHVFAAAAEQYVQAYRPPAPAFSLYMVGKPRPVAALTNEQWADWTRLSVSDVMARFGDVLARAFRANRPCLGLHMGAANARPGGVSG